MEGRHQFEFKSYLNSHIDVVVLQLIHGEPQASTVNQTQEKDISHGNY